MIKIFKKLLNFSDILTMASLRLSDCKIKRILLKLYPEHMLE